MTHVHQDQILITELHHLRATFQWSEERGLGKEFAYSFMRLLSLIAADAKPDTGSVVEKVTYGHIGSDWAPHSFRWHFGYLRRGQEPERMHRGDGFQMNGGLIHHGPADNGFGGMPALSVALGRDPVANPHEWRIHT